MKKVLLASTALAMTAGMAAAEVTLSGYAEIGIKQAPVTQADTGEDSDEILFHHDLDVKFTLSGETETGLVFGATIDLDELDNQETAGDIGSEEGAHSVFISGDFGTLTMGDTDGAFDWALAEIAWGSAIADDHSSHAGWNGNAGLDGDLDGQVLRYDYSFGDFSVALSAEIGDQSTDADEIYGIGGRYSADFGGTSLGFGLGYQTGSYKAPSVAGTPTGTSVGLAEADIYGASVAADFDNGLSVRVNFSQLDGDAPVTAGATTTTEDLEWTHYGIGARYAFDALSVEANYGQFDGELAGSDFEADGWGIAVNYDLGGGAVAMFGYGSGDGFAFDGTERRHG